MAKKEGLRSLNWLQDKRELFDGLDSLWDDANDSAPDPGRESSLNALRLQFSRGHKESSRELRRNSFTPSTLISSSASISPDNTGASTHRNGASPTSALSNDNSRVPPAVVETTKNHITNEILTTPATVIPTKRGRKRKRDEKSNVIPEEQQIFKTLHFYFFPNTDTHIARKIRIAKAREFGATWERDWNPSITHVISDKAMSFDLLIKFNKLERVPPGIVVVSENYPAECISNRILLDPTHAQFRVKGHKQTVISEDTASGPERSLKLKAAGQDVIIRSPSSRSRSPDQPLLTSSATLPDVIPNTGLPDVAQHVSALEDTVELAVAIREARELGQIPLEEEEDDERTCRPCTSDCSTDDEKRNSSFSVLKSKRDGFKRWQDKYQCMYKHVGGDLSNVNASTTDVLQRMANYYGQIDDQWRFRAYRKAISALRNHPSKIQTKEEALSLPQIGERLATKIEEIVFTNKLARLDNIAREPQDQILKIFMGIYGVGFAQAIKWIAAGFTTLDDLLNKADLSANQRVGIEHYVDFNSRIPRAEVAQHGAVVRHTLQLIDPSFEVIVGGSYRRSAQTSGDIDCLITRPDSSLEHIRPVVFEQLVPSLKAQGFLVAELTSSSRGDGSKWHGASVLPSPSSSCPAGDHQPTWRRIDFLIVPADEIGAALIYWTGNDIFNRSLRLLASKKGMNLNQRGLYQGVLRGQGREKLTTGKLIEGRSEKKIFEVLGVPWRPPEHRNC